ncbi:hypothetical protein CAEBREN_14689 [Caenorhabditis brenneri]|uniref:ribonuclease H n=1 Tax=Caenorhabditis brenneri TaxID=135651 RepID=G0PGA1_CAEBE|nr:hypothetical protein CAEBREN_14689 [Caenorhabditis brenneri]
MSRRRRPSYIKTLRIYTDGCALRNGQPGAKGGWAIVFEDNNEFENDSDWCTTCPQTNNCFELMAVIEALRNALRRGGVYHVIIVTDSKYVISALTEWIHKWKSNNWLNCKGKPVMNRELIETIDSMTQNMIRRGGSVKYEHVNGHSGNRWNDMADAMAKEAAAQNPIYDDSDDEY